MLDYVLNLTGEEKLYYVGHSQGTIMGFAGFSSNQTLAKHIHVFFALAPVTKVKHIQGAFKIISEFSSQIEVIILDKEITLHCHCNAVCDEHFH